MGHRRFADAARALGVAAILLPLAAHAEERGPGSAGDRSALDGAAASSSTTTSVAGRAGGHARSAASDAILPGFEMLADGSTRLFIELSRPVTYETRVARGSITYVLKGVRVERRNNQNPLVTVYFNTPVTSARLLPHGRDLWFVVALRSAVQPAVAMDAGKDGGAILRIEFPKGNYIRGKSPDPANDSSGDAADEPSPDGVAKSVH